MFQFELTQNGYTELHRLIRAAKNIFFLIYALSLTQNRLHLFCVLSHRVLFSLRNEYFFSIATEKQIKMQNGFDVNANNSQDM